MNRRTIVTLLLCFTLPGPLLQSEEPPPQIPQVVLLAPKQQKCDWHEGMTLGEALIKMGGVSVATVTIVRNGNQERLNVTRDFSRPLAAWDIIVVGR